MADMLVTNVYLKSGGFVAMRHGPAEDLDRDEVGASVDVDLTMRDSLCAVDTRDAYVSVPTGNVAFTATYIVGDEEFTGGVSRTELIDAVRDSDLSDKIVGALLTMLEER